MLAEAWGLGGGGEEGEGGRGDEVEGGYNIPP